MTSLSLPQLVLLRMLWKDVEHRLFSLCSVIGTVSLPQSNSAFAREQLGTEAGYLVLTASRIAKYMIDYQTDGVAQTMTCTIVRINRLYLEAAVNGNRGRSHRRRMRSFPPPLASPSSYTGHGHREASWTGASSSPLSTFSGANVIVSSAPRTGFLGFVRTTPR